MLTITSQSMRVSPMPVGALTLSLRSGSPVGPGTVASARTPDWRCPPK
jgi:hypothetical protein